MITHEIYRKAYVAHYDDGDYDKAIAGYKQIIELYPDSAEADFAKKKLPSAELEKKWKQGGRKQEKEVLVAEKKLPSVGVQLTTSHHIEGFKTVKTLGVVSAECASFMDVCPDTSPRDADMAEGGCEIIENVLSKTRIACLKKIHKSAAAIGANAVIAIKLSHGEFLRKKGSILYTTAYGTAVLARKTCLNGVSEI